MGNNRGSSALVIVLMIVLLGAGGYILYQTMSYNDLNKKYNNVNNQYIELSNKGAEQVEDESLKEGYVVYKTGSNGIYKIYGIGAYVTSNGIVVGYNDSLYYVHGLPDDFQNISKISTINFDSNGFYNEDGTYIKKFKGKESDLVKVTFSRSVYGTDGSPYPIVIYKDGSVESRIEDVENVLKNYKIKDFIGEECIENNSENGLCSKASYEVVLQDGSTQKVQ